MLLPRKIDRPRAVPLLLLRRQMIVIHAQQQANSPKMIKGCEKEHRNGNREDTERNRHFVEHVPGGIRGREYDRQTDDDEERQVLVEALPALDELPIWKRLGVNTGDAEPENQQALVAIMSI